jgi:hypothetical protein
LDGIHRDFQAYPIDNKQLEVKSSDTIPGYGWKAFIFLYLISPRAPIRMGVDSGRGGDGMQSA